MRRRSPFEQPSQKGGAEDVGDFVEKFLGRVLRAGLEPLLMGHAHRYCHKASFKRITNE